MARWSEEELARLLESRQDITADQQVIKIPKPVDDYMRVPTDLCLTPGARFKSKTEYLSMQALVNLYDPDKMLYEPHVFHLPSGNYTPDWMMCVKGTLFYVEVKGAGGFKAYQSGRSSSKSLKEAAYHYGWMAVWLLMVHQGKHDWRYEIVKGTLIE